MIIIIMWLLDRRFLARCIRISLYRIAKNFANRLGLSFGFLEVIFIETTIAYIIFIYFIVNMGFIPYYISWNNFHIFNPIRNYNTWTHVNWFGIVIITLLLNVVFAPYAIVYWIYKLFTVGRKEK